MVVAVDVRPDLLPRFVERFWAFDQEALQSAARQARIAAAADKAAADDRWREKHADRLAAIEA